MTDTPIRPDEDIHPLTIQAIRSARTPTPAEFDVMRSVEDIDAEIARVSEMMDTVEDDLIDEQSLPLAERDPVFINRANKAVKTLNAIRHGLTARRAIVLRDQARARLDEIERIKERVFIDVARSMVPADLYKQMWAEVERRKAAQ